MKDEYKVHSEKAIFSRWWAWDYLKARKWELTHTGHDGAGDYHEHKKAWDEMEVHPAGSVWPHRHDFFERSGKARLLVAGSQAGIIRIGVDAWEGIQRYKGLDVYLVSLAEGLAMPLTRASVNLRMKEYKVHKQSKCEPYIQLLLTHSLRGK